MKRAMTGAQFAKVRARVARARAEEDAAPWRCEGCNAVVRRIAPHRFTECRCTLALRSHGFQEVRA